MTEQYLNNGLNDSIKNRATLGRTVFNSLEALGITPNENLGQHFLIDKVALDLLAHSVTPGNTVLEIGAGVGQLTEALAKNAFKVISIEIDRRYEPVLNELSSQYPNLQIIYGDALALRLNDFIANGDESDTQIIASLPYHITEPFMRRLAGLDIESATMIVGRKLAESVQAPDEKNLGFGKMTLLAQSFFDAEVLIQLGKDSFFPPPSTESTIIRLIPKVGESSMRDFLLRKLFTTSRQNPLVENCLKEGLTEFMECQNLGARSKKERSKITRRRAKYDLQQARYEYNAVGIIDAPTDTSNSRIHLLRVWERTIVTGFKISSDILGKPFDKLNNSELRTLSLALRGKDR